MTWTSARVTCCTCVPRALAAPEMFIVGGVTTISTGSINYDLLPCNIFQHVIWFMGRTWHVLHTCISQFPHFSGFWECHHRNHDEILHMGVQSLVMGIFSRVESILRHRELGPTLKCKQTNSIT